MQKLGASFRRYKPKNPEKGVFQDNALKGNFVSLKGSSFFSDRSNETVVLYKDNKLWQSDQEQYPNFTITLSSHLLKLTSLSMLSCYESGCAYDFMVLGSNKGNDWEEVCKINISVDYFKGSIKNAPCKSNYQYKQYRIMHNGKNEIGRYNFPMYYLELFGDLHNINCQIVKCSLRNSFANRFICLIICLLSS